MPIMDMLPKGDTLQIPLDAPTSLAATAGNAQVELTWTDPADKYATPEGEVSETGDQLVSEWDHTVLVRKTGSQPAGPNDGTVVVSSSVRDQYQTTPYTDTGLTNDTEYFYGVFAYNKDGVASEGAFVTATPKAGTPLSELAEGTLIKINENGSPVEFYLAKHNYEPGLNGQGRELCVRKECSVKSVWTTRLNEYAGSTIDVYMNGSYKNLFSSGVQALIGTTSFYYTPGESTQQSDVTVLQRSIFTPSLTEFGWNEPEANTEGSVLPNAITIRKVSNTEDEYTRTPSTSHNGPDDQGYMRNIWIVADCNTDSPYPNDWVANNAKGAGYRPCFTLPSTALVTEELELVEG